MTLARWLARRRAWTRSRPPQPAGQAGRPARRRGPGHLAVRAARAAYVASLTDDGRSLTRLSPPLPDDTDAEPLTWGADGRLPRPRSLDERDGEHGVGARRAVGRYTPEILT